MDQIDRLETSEWPRGTNVVRILGDFFGVRSRGNGGSVVGPAFLGRRGSATGRGAGGGNHGVVCGFNLSLTTAQDLFWRLGRVGIF